MDSELLHADAVCVVNVEVVDTYYTDPGVFELNMPARQETLRYYVVASGYSDTDMDALSVSDGGFAGDGRPKVTFLTIESESFTPEELPADMLATGDQKVVVFKSTSAIPRRSAGRRGIQLLSGSDVIVDNLPQPSPDKADAHMIVHIAKP